ncbi:MAG TPA: hypothetical protein VK907_07835, partial [Phnomibacter sp.]|nr:hypothetical protein [Phnomibacter sp.]
SGPFSKELVVLSNDRQHYNRIWVEGDIRPMKHPVADEFPYNYGKGLHMRFQVLAFGYVRPGATKQMELLYTNDTDDEMQLDLLPVGNMAGLRFGRPGKVAPRAKGVIRFSYTMPMVVTHDQYFSLVPVINNERSDKTIDIRVLYDNGPAGSSNPVQGKVGPR